MTTALPSRGMVGPGEIAKGQIAALMLTCATVVGGMLFLLDATVLGAANRRAETLKDLMKGAPAIRPFQQPWVVGRDGTIYYLSGYDRLHDRVAHVDVYEFDVSYLVQFTDDEPKIILFISHQGEDEAMKEVARMQKAA